MRSRTRLLRDKDWCQGAANSVPDVLAVIRFGVRALARVRPQYTGILIVTCRQPNEGSSVIASIWDCRGCVESLSLRLPFATAACCLQHHRIAGGSAVAAQYMLLCSAASLSGSLLHSFSSTAQVESRCGSIVEVVTWLQSICVVTTEPDLLATAFSASIPITGSSEFFLPAVEYASSSFLIKA